MHKQTENKITALYYRTAQKTTPDMNLDNQMQTLLCYAQERGLAGFTVYADNGANGLTLDRPALNALKADIQAGCVGEIVVKDTSRIARGFILFMEFTDWIKSRGAEIVSLNDGGRAEPLHADMAALCRSLLKGGERA
jgi:DNA invertase Pin-like site-specific DNA recombinase